MRCIKMNSSYTKLIKNLEYLKLDQMVIHLDETIDFMNNNQLSFAETLIKLTDYEIDMKEISRAKAMVKVAAFPHLKEVKDFNFSFQPSVNQEQILDFTTLRFIERKENIVFLGTSGVGKTHLATSIGIAAAKKRTSYYFIKCNDLILNLNKPKYENRLDAKLKHYSKYKLLIIDEVGYLPIDAEDAKLFFQLIDLRYETKSTIFTTHSNFKSWGDIFQDTKLASAILDRILHHATVVNIVGDSYRLKDHIQTENKES